MVCGVYKWLGNVHWTLVMADMCGCSENEMLWIETKLLWCKVFFSQTNFFLKKCTFILYLNTKNYNFWYMKRTGVDSVDYDLIAWLCYVSSWLWDPRAFFFLSRKFSFLLVFMCNSSTECSFTHAICVSLVWIKSSYWWL